MGDAERREGCLPTGGSCAGVVGNPGLRHASRVGRPSRQWIDVYNISLGGKHWPMVMKAGEMAAPFATGSLH